MTQLTIPRRLQWIFRRGFSAPPLPSPALVDQWLNADALAALDTYNQLVFAFGERRTELGTLDPDGARRADDEARGRAFATNTQAPAPTEPAVRARVAELEAELRVAETVLRGALERVGRAVLADQQATLDRMAVAVAEIPARVRALHGQLAADLDSLDEIIATANWVTKIELSPAFQVAHAGRAEIDRAFEQLDEVIATMLDRAFAPIPPLEPTLGDIAELYGDEAAKEYAAEVAKHRTVG